jgi:hypothetical protein
VFSGSAGRAVSGVGHPDPLVARRGMAEAWEEPRLLWPQDREEVLGSAFGRAPLGEAPGPLSASVDCSPIRAQRSDYSRAARAPAEVDDYLTRWKTEPWVLITVTPQRIATRAAGRRYARVTPEATALPLSTHQGTRPDTP